MSKSIMFASMASLVPILAVSALVSATAAMAQSDAARSQDYLPSWEIAGQFNPRNDINSATNPFEAWTYGYTVSPDCGGPVVPFRYKKQAANLAGRATGIWSMGPNPDTNTNDLPLVSQSEGGTQLSPLRYSPQGLAIHPGPANSAPWSASLLPQQASTMSSVASGLRTSRPEVPTLEPACRLTVRSSIPRL